MSDATPEGDVVHSTIEAAADESDPTFFSDSEDSYRTSESTESLQWDSSQPLSIQTSWSPVNEPADDGRGISVLGDIANRRKLSSGVTVYSLSIGDNSETGQDSEPQDVSGSNDSNQTTINMPTEAEKKRHRAAIEKADILWKDDLEPMDLSESTTEYIKEYAAKASVAKSELQDAQVFWQVQDREVYETDYKDRIDRIKIGLLNFIRQVQSHMKREEAKRPQATGLPESQQKSLKIKYDRVERLMADTCSDLDELANKFKDLYSGQVNTDVDYRAMEELAKSHHSSADMSYNEARELYNDAMEAGHTEAVERIEGSLRRLKNDRSKLAEYMAKQKSDLGICGYQSGSGRLVDDKPPVFFGEAQDKLDYYSFKTEFEDYLKTRALSKADRLKFLQKTCLRGTAQTACMNYTTIEEVWDHLKENWGNIKTLLAMKLDELKRLGKCGGGLIKQREWAVSVKRKIMYLISLAKSHGIEQTLYHMPGFDEVLSNLPTDMHKKFKTILLDKQKLAGKRGMDVPREEMIDELVNFMDEVIADFTFDINFNLSHGKEVPKPSIEKQFRPVQNQPGKKYFNTGLKNRKSSGVKNRQQHSSTPVFNGSQPKLMYCSACQGKHTHMYYCGFFQDSSIKERYFILRNLAVCFRCLRLDSEVDLTDRNAWWDKHKTECDGTWSCKQSGCSNKADNRQSHFLLCAYHYKDNANVVDKFVKSLDQTLIHPNVKFLFLDMRRVFSNTPKANPPTNDSNTINAEPDVTEPCIFMMEHIERNGRSMLMLYDTGCTTATVSSRAAEILGANVLTAGPTYLEVAGGKTLRIEHGEVRFHLELAGSDKAATITALQMDEITTPFPLWDQMEAWSELKQDYEAKYPDGEPLPAVRDRIGGAPVDIMVGISYLKYYPIPLHTLPCGLTLYKSKFSSGGKSFGILGGPHKAWRSAHEVINMLKPKMFFTMEAKAYCHEKLALNCWPYNNQFDGSNHMKIETALLECEPTAHPLTLESDDDVNPNVSCVYQHCEKHGKPQNIEFVGVGTYNIRNDKKRFDEVESLGSGVEYRCVKCRNCNDCKKGEQLERASLEEEVQQALIESCLRYDPENKTLMSHLPFLVEPTDVLAPSYNAAERVLESQLKLAGRSDDLRRDIIKSHNKLRDKNFVMPYDELPQHERQLMDTTPEPGYFIPWRTVFKENSITTPCRLVYDGSQATKTGVSLNSILAKGKNNLARVLHIFIKFT